MEQFNLIMTGKRIANKRREMKLTLQELADAVGVAASTIQRYEKGEITRPKIPVIKSIAAALGTSFEWLAGITDDEQPLPDNAFEADLSSNVRIPIIGRVAAGLACHAEEYTEGYEYTSPDNITEGERYVYLRVKGDSMSPLIREGDLVLVRCQEMVDSGTYAVVIIDNEDGVVKRVYFERNKITLKSENPYYPPRVFEDEECARVRIFGKVIESKHKF